MSTLKVTNIENPSTTSGGIDIDTSGHVTVDGVAMPSAGPLSNRNLIVNGAMQVSQRATSKTGLTGSINDYYTVDRYKFENYSNASDNSSVWTMEQSTDAPEGFSYSLKCTATTADSDYGSADSQSNIHTRLEAQNLQHLKYGTANAENLTLSFWVKSSVTGTYLAWFYQSDDNRHCTKTYTINSANTWEYKTVTISGDTTGVIDNDNGDGLHVRWVLASGTGFTSGTYLDGSWAAFTSADTYAGHAVNVASTVNNTFLITGVQLEVGSVATPFEHRSFGDELARCQRYYTKIKHSAGANYGQFAVVVVPSTGTDTRGGMSLPTTMRQIPTLGYSALSDFHFLGLSGAAPTSIVLADGGTSDTYVGIRFLTTSQSANSCGTVRANNNNDAYLDFDAEL